MNKTKIPFEAEDLEMMIDALMFNSCVDLSQNVDEIDSDRMIDLALKLAEYLPDFKSKRNCLYDGVIREDIDRVNKIQKFVMVR